MKCKGSHYSGSILAKEVEPVDAKANAEKVCGSIDWELIWAHALKEEGRSIHLWQCKRCKRVVTETDEWKDSNNWV